MSDIASPDRRIRKTKVALSGALMGLLRKVPWDDITIQMICDRADVARSSFYAHFDGKVDLLDHVIAVELAGVQARPARQGELQSLRWLVDHILSDRPFFARMAASHAGQVVFSRFRLAVRHMVQDELAQRQPPVPDYLAGYIVGGSFEVIQRWTIAPEGQSAEGLMQAVQHLAARLLDGH